MENLVDRLVSSAREARQIYERLKTSPIAERAANLIDATTNVGLAASGSWLGYHANVYKRDLKPRQSGDYFDVDGPSPWSSTRGSWGQFTLDEVRKEVLRQAKLDDTEALEEAFKESKELLNAVKLRVLASIDAYLAHEQDKVLAATRDELSELPTFLPQDSFATSARPTQAISGDMKAIQGGFQTPPHLAIRYWLMQLMSPGDLAKEFAEKLTYLREYLEQRGIMKGISSGKKDGKIFIGHGKAAAWKDLKEFVVERLKLEHDEFNRESPAGRSTKERLQQMLDNACFAFLVMTAEDVTAEGDTRARQNVVHEAGLFQGRLGFERAIVLLEDGCAEFSNISGLGQIRFKKGNISAAFEEIRKVLERESII